jgi:hypothetical protein
MSHVYVMEKDSGTKRLDRVAVANEDKELQLLLERNLDLLPGDQISPGKSLRWLLVKREMPVVSPSSGDNTWSIDFLLVDQDGVPTFVECKRRNDTRSRREVVGQMLEYVANGRHYWRAAEFQGHAQNAAGDESKLTQLLKDLTGSETAPEEFFAAMEKNLQRSKIRLIFFLEDSPPELRSIVEFLNGQLKDMEVLIVEARQYQHGDARIVVPWLFGFTEEARAAKRDSKSETVRSSLPKGEDPYWEGIEASALSGEWKRRIRDFVSAVAASGCELKWLRTCNVYLPGIVPQKSLLQIGRDGSIWLYFVSWRPRNGSTLTEDQQSARNYFFNKLQAMFGFSQDDLQTKSYPNLAADRWLPKSDELAEVIHHLASFPRAPETAEESDQLEPVEN